MSRVTPDVVAAVGLLLLLAVVGLMHTSGDTMSQPVPQPTMGR